MYGGMVTEAFFKCEHDVATIVLIGSFNPAIFHPAWFASSALIRKEESETATIEVVSQMVSSFKTEWLQVQVTNDRFAASSTSPAHHEPLRDLVLGVFSLLEHTPTKAMGLNRTLHFRIPTPEQWNKIGHSLVPKDFWRGFLKDPVTRTVTVQGQRENSESKLVTVKVEPSQLLPGAIVVDCNEHFEPVEPDVRKLMAGLGGSWMASMEFAMNAAEALLVSSGQ